MKKIALIPARYAASRFPGKMMADLGGKTVIWRTYESALKTGLFDEVAVVCDHPIIYDEISAHGGKVIMSKREHECGTDRIAEAAEEMDADIIVNVQGDEPLIDPNVIDLLAKTLVERAELDMVTVATPLKNDDYEDPSAVKVVVNQKGEALYFSRALIPYPRHDFVVPALKHIGIYAYRREFLLKYAHMKQTPLEMAESLEQLRALESGHKIGVITVETEDIGIDTEEDLKKVNAYFERSQL